MTEFELTPSEAPGEPTLDHAYVEQGVSVFSVDDGYSWYAARDAEEAKQAALKDWGGEREEYWGDGMDDVYPCDLDKNTVNTHEDGDPTGPILTWRAYLKQELAAGTEVPFFFCGTD